MRARPQKSTLSGCTVPSLTLIDSAILAWTAEIVGRVVSRSQSGASKEWTACERRKRSKCRKALVQCSESVVLTMIENPKGIALASCRILWTDLGEVVVGGTVERVVKARVVCRIPEGAAR